MKIMKGVKDMKKNARPHFLWRKVRNVFSQLSKIAKEIHGGPSLYSKIFEANTDPLKNPDLIQVGTAVRASIVNIMQSLNMQVPAGAGS